MTFPESTPKYPSNTSPADTPPWRAHYCSGCALLLTGLAEPHECAHEHGTFCTQCGRLTHEYVCSPAPA